MKKVRIAVIGAGLVGKRHAGMVAAGRHCALAGIGDTNPGMIEFARSLGTSFFSDIDTLLDTVKPDGAIIATPNSTHYAIAAKCARRSIDVLIEKPLAHTLKNARQIIQLEETYGIHILVGQHRRYNPLVKKAKELVESGQLGKLTGVSVLWALMKPVEYYDLEWRRTRPGGGPVLINLIHEIDSLRFICGGIKSVYSQYSSDVRRFEVEDTASVSLTFQNGALGTVLLSDAAPSPWSYEITTGENAHYFNAKENCAFFMGSEGSLAFPKMELWKYRNRKDSGWQYPMDKLVHPVRHEDPLVLQLEHFCAVIQQKATPAVTAGDAAKTLEATLAVFDSARKGRAIQLTGK
ncbi:MAG: Gfo/Idh/MocA family oxidoreductase [Spirochaetales bacterium]|nr:Gfo/Idh/MocA family oxidoreductase [Spirochaetales bacterium]